MEDQIKSASWALGAWGVMSVIFGLLIMAWPGITLQVFLVILGIYLLASGVVMVIGSLVSHERHWIGGALIGFLGVLAGLYVFANPTTTGLVLLSVIAIWSIVVGALEVVAGFEAGKHGWWVIVSGIISVLFGAYIFANPRNGAIALVWLIGIYSVVSGLVLAVAALKIGRYGKQLKRA